MAETIAVLSQKGGTGKTTLVRSLADVLERIDLRVLAVDCDPQGNLSDYYDVDPEAEPTLAEVLLGQAHAPDAIHDGVIPSNLRLAEAELELAARPGRERALRQALAEAGGGFDFVLLDCPPALGLLTVNALVAADRALLSAQPEYFAMQGVEQALEVTEIVRASQNPELGLLGIVLNIADMRAPQARRTREALRAYFGDAVCATVIPRSTSYAESAERAAPILEHDPLCGLDYVRLAIELLGRLEKAEAATRARELAARIEGELEAAEQLHLDERSIRAATEP
jgi:chromosome partitioning protein